MTSIQLSPGRLLSLLGIRKDTSEPSKVEQSARKLVDLVNSTRGPVCLNLACGNRYLPGWINIDISDEWSPSPDVLLDLTREIPLPDESADFLLSEDFLEHIDLSNGKRFLKECCRILKPGGVFRLLTPNLYTFALAYINKSDGDLEGYTKEFGATTHAEMFNLGMRAWGHTFLYDEELLLKTLNECGFTAQRVSFSNSTEVILRNVDLRDSIHTMFFELRKNQT